MTVELRPLGVKCNIQCQYCYQNPQRDAGTVLHSYDLEKMMAAVEQEGGPFAMFGGEPLLVPVEDLETLWSWGLEKYASNSIQTNGALINDEHIRLFRQYRVSVGISIDGPAELNDARWAGTVQHTRQVTDDVHEVIERLCREGMPPGLIITLHRGNATRDRLPAMNAWLKRLEGLGVRSAVLHILEVDHEDVGRQYALNTEQNLEALQNFAELGAELTTLRIKLFDDMRDLLLGRDERADCVWNACDPYTTRAVRGVEGNGQRTNCGRTNKEGIEFAKAGVEGFERYLALYHTPREHGGCQGCRFFLMCKGQCPGTAIAGDWRKRTQYCEVWMELYERLERRLIEQGQTPLSVSPRRSQVEAAFLGAWSEGRNTRLAEAIEQVEAEDKVVVSLRETSSSVRSANGQLLPDRLSFTLPDFTRVAWVSDHAREVWAPRLLRIRDAWPRIEMMTVAVGIRRCAVLSLTSEQLSAHAQQRAGHGLEVQPLDSASPEGPSLLGRCVVGRPQDIVDFKHARGAADHRQMGRLLGHPECCLEFFRHVWVDEGIEDTTWPMALATVEGVQGSTAEVTGPPQANILWRWLDIRAVPHLPCRFDCVETVSLADRFADAARQASYEDEMDWLLEILDWPVEWSALHGIAEVRTPVLKFSTRTDATAGEYIVRRLGVGYPAEGAQGLRFPYLSSRQPLFTLSTSFQRGLENAPKATSKCDGS